MAQKRFLTITAVAVVVALAALTIVGTAQYKADSTRWSSSFVTTDQVENFPYSLLSSAAQEALR